MSLNAELAIINNAEYAGRRIFAGLNSKAGFIIFDFVHACGLPMEEVQDELAGTEKANLTLPGFFEGSDKHILMILHSGSIKDRYSIRRWKLRLQRLSIRVRSATKCGSISAPCRVVRKNIQRI